MFADLLEVVETTCIKHVGSWQLAANLLTNNETYCKQTRASDGNASGYRLNNYTKLDASCQHT